MPPHAAAITGPGPRPPTPDQPTPATSRQQPAGKAQRAFPDPSRNPGWEETRERSGGQWWATMRLAGRVALHRSAVHLVAGSVPTMREQLLKLEIPRTFLLPADDAPLPGADELAAAGVSVVAVPDCGHNIMLDNPEGFVRAVAEAGRPVQLSPVGQRPR